MAKKTLKQLMDFRHGLGVKARQRLLSKALNERSDSLKFLGYADYAAYLATALWALIRRKVYDRAKGKCEACGERQAANVHHWSYSIATLQGRKLQNLEAVCKECHDQFHQVLVWHPTQMSPKRARREAYWKLVRTGGAIAQPRDITPRLVKKPA